MLTTVELLQDHTSALAFAHHQHQPFWAVNPERAAASQVTATVMQHEVLGC
jgi:hypothetical protein